MFKPLGGSKHNPSTHKVVKHSVPFGDIEEEKHDSSDEEEAKYSKKGSGNNAKKNQSVA